MFGLSEKGLSKKHTVKVCSHPGDRTEDLEDDFKPIMTKNHDLIIIHFGTNDITNNGVNTKEKLQDTIDYVHEHSPETNKAPSNNKIRTEKKKTLPKSYLPSNWKFRSFTCYQRFWK